MKQERRLVSRCIWVMVPMVAGLSGCGTSGDDAGASGGTAGPSDAALEQGNGSGGKEGGGLDGPSGPPDALANEVGPSNAATACAAYARAYCGKFETCAGASLVAYYGDRSTCEG